MIDLFYHASNVGDLKELLPLSTAHGSGDKVCYFTPVRAYALFYLRDMVINHVTCGVSESGVTVYNEQFPDQLKTIYQGRSGYLYTCENDGGIITAHTNGVWAARQPIKVANTEFITDVYAEILKAERSGEIQVIRYESLSDEKKQEITLMMRDNIIKNDWLQSDSLKARFFKDNFPQSWELAEKEISTDINAYIISTTRLTLRPLKLRDWREVHAYAGNADNTRYVTALPNLSEDDTRSYLIWVEDQWNKAEGQTYFCYAAQLNNKLIGEIAFGYDKGTSEWSMGWIIHRDYWNRGYATEAVKAIINHCFQKVDIVKLIASCDVENIACRCVCEKAGMIVHSENEPWEYKNGRVSKAIRYVIEK